MAKKKKKSLKKKYGWVWWLFLLLLAVAVCVLVIVRQIRTRADAADDGTEIVVYFEYDSEGRPTVTEDNICTVYAAEDLNSTVLERQYLNSDGSVAYSYSYVYNDAGRLIRRNKFDSAGLLSGFSEYEYDDAGRNTRINCYEDDEFSCYFLNTFDDSGRKSEAAEYDPDGTLIERWVYAYDRHGDVASITLYSASGAVLGTGAGDPTA